MPFKKIGKNDYVSPGGSTTSLTWSHTVSGKHWNMKQIRLYYATEGFTKNTNKSKKRINK